MRRRGGECGSGEGQRAGQQRPGGQGGRDDPRLQSRHEMLLSGIRGQAAIPAGRAARELATNLILQVWDLSVPRETP
jgi:hypothetical protein